MQDMRDFEGLKAVVTGGGSGIGAAMVEAFADQKANVAFVDIAVEPSKELVAKIGAAHQPRLVAENLRLRGFEGVYRIIAPSEASLRQQITIAVTDRTTRKHATGLAVTEAAAMVQPFR